MGKRVGNQLPNNLPQLQNLIKRNPSLYHDEFMQTYRHYEAMMELFRLNPNNYSKDLDEQLMFLAHVAYCYPKDMANFPKHLIEFLRQHYSYIHPEMRLALVKSLVLTRNKNLVEPLQLMELFFEMLKSRDKNLRKFLRTSIVADIKNSNSKHKNHKLNKPLQNFLYRVIDGKDATAVKMSLDIMIELYCKNVWNDERTVNVIANGLFSPFTKAMVTALQFFLSKDAATKEESDSEDEVDPNDLVGKTQRQKIATKMKSKKFLSKGITKKTKKRQRMLDDAKRILKSNKRKSKAPAFNFSALHLLHDPEGICERLLKRLNEVNERFEVRLMVMDLVSRLIGVHQLLVLNYYSLIKKFLQPHQREVTTILRCTAQSCHDLVPPEDIEPLLREIANNFVSDRNSAEAMAVGLNAIREICLRCPLAMGKPLLDDLSAYKRHSHKNVSVAAQSVIVLYRQYNREMLAKKYRGRPTQDTQETKVLQYGERNTKDFVSGAEVLDNADEEETEKKEDGWETASEDEDSDGSGEWVNVSHSEDEAEEEEKEGSKLTREQMEDKAREICSSRILTQDEIKKIQIHQMKKKMVKSLPKKGSGAKRKAPEPSEEALLTADTDQPELVPLSAIERLSKRVKVDRESRLATILKEKEDKEKWQRNQKKSEFASKSTREQKKNKAFMMIKHKAKNKFKRSFTDRQAALKKSLIKQRRLLNIK